MPKDSRYRNAQKLILAGLIKNLPELLDAIDKTPLAKSIHTSPERFNKLIHAPELFKFEDCYAIAKLLEVDEASIIAIVHETWKGKQKGKRK